MSRLLAVAAIAVLLSPFVHAQEMRRAAGGGLPPYDLATERHVSGTLKGHDDVTTPAGDVLVVLRVDVNKAPLRVLVGPKGWVDQQSWTFPTDATLEIVGAGGEGMKFMGEPAMLARTLKVGAKTFVVRDAKGVPAWESR